MKRRGVAHDPEAVQAPPAPRRVSQDATAALLSRIGNRGFTQLARQPAPPQTQQPPKPDAAADAATKELLGAKIKKSVGAGGTNDAADKEIVKKLLAAAGFTDPDLETAIRRFQRISMGASPSRADGNVGPTGPTFKALKAAATTPGGAVDASKKKSFWADDDWENLLPKAPKTKHFTRDGAFAVKDSQKDKDKPALTDEQKKVVAQIKKNRDALPDLLAGHKGKRGYNLGDSRSADENATPTEVTNETDKDRKQLTALIWDELGTEAALEGIQTYDSEGWGWGKGWSAKGSMSAVMDNLFKLDPDAEKLLFDAGVAMSGNNRGTFKVVNEDTGAVEDGDNAVEYMRVSPRLLSIFVTLGTDKAHKQHATDAQWMEMERKAGKVPAYASKWLGTHDATLRFLIHGSHWMPSAGWGSHDYSGTGGDLFKVVKQYCSHLAAKEPSGALVVPARLGFGTPGARMDHWAGGKAAAAVKSESGVKQITITPQQLAAKEDAKGPEIDGHVLIPITKDLGGTIDNNKYWDLGKL